MTDDEYNTAIYNRLDVNEAQIMQLPDGNKWKNFLLPQRSK